MTGFDGRAPGSAPNPSPPDPAQEKVTFVQHRLPGLDAGVYRLSVEQHVLAADQKTQLSTAPISRDYHLAVGGPRFRLLDPATTISSVFPASNATGDFHAVLPHVVLSSPSLPWIRSPQATKGSLRAAQEADVPSWLAVLTLDDADVAAYPELVLDPLAAMVGDLFPAAATSTRTLPAPALSYFDGATDTDGLEPGEAVTDPIQIIDLPLGLFAAVAPTMEDLALNAHVRQLSLQAKPSLLGAAPADPLGTYAIVIGNRLPQNVQTSHAYLVSLEALSGLLPPGGSTGGSVRLAVLAHWTFVSQGDPLDFTTTVASLNGRSPDGPDAAVTTLRLARDVPSTGVGAAIGAALNAGYAPLAHELRTGETTVSWFRGPLSPDDAPPVPDLPVPYSCSDAALVFDPTTGLFDASLAAAWTVGRLIALQDKAFSAALYSWKRGLTQAMVSAAERDLIVEVLGDGVADDQTSKPLLHATMRLLTQGRG